MGRGEDSWAGSAVQRREVVPQHHPAQLAVAGGGLEPSQLAGVVTPWFVAGEQQPVMPDAAPLDFLDEPPRSETDRPAGTR